MIVADPTRTTRNAEAIAKILADRLHLDYFDLLAKLTKKGTRFVYVARRVPSTLASSVMDELKRHEYVGVDTRSDPLRTYPAGDVAANLVGFIGDDAEPRCPGPRAELRQAARRQGRQGDLRGRRRQPDPARRQQPRSSRSNGKDLPLTIDRDVQWYSQRVLRDRGPGGQGRVGRGRRPRLPHRRDPRPRRLPDLRPEQARQGDEGGPRQPGAERRLRAGLGGEGAHRGRPDRRGQGHPADPDPRARASSRSSTARSATGSTTALIRLTMAGVIARSSNIGTALAADAVHSRAAVALPRPVRPGPAHRRRACPVRPEACCRRPRPGPR